MTRLAKTAIPTAANPEPRLTLAGARGGDAAPAIAPTRAIAADDMLSGAELSRTELEALFALATACKENPEAYAGALAGKSVALLFEKPSLRTRVSFEVGLHRLGGQAIFLDQQGSKIGAREAIKDYAKNLERWCHALVGRVDRHATLAALADHASVPVVNALCDQFHPCQALADYLTLRERLGSLQGARLAYVGDGNNVCHSLLLLGARLGVNITVISPPGHGPDPMVAQQACAIAALTGGWIDITTDLGAVRGADAVYTDAWTSMGTKETPERLAAFEPYRVDSAVMAMAASGRPAGACPGAPEPLFMHCLPAHRGQEVTDEVIDSDASVVYDQAENRLHAQCALLLMLLGKGGVAGSSGVSGGVVTARGAKGAARRVAPLLRG